MSAPRYRENYNHKLKENLANFNLEDYEVKIKVEKFCIKFGFDQDKVKEKIRDDVYLRAWFIKDPAKQNIYEKTFAQFLKNIDGVRNFKKLSNSGPNSKFIINQEVRTSAEAEKAIIKLAKSMDFFFNFRNLPNDFYVFHKYTNEPGGAQDNQKENVITAIKNASAAHVTEGFIVLFICDGDYYVGKKWEDIKANIRDSNFKLLKSDMLEEYLNGLCGRKTVESEDSFRTEILT